MMQTSSVKKAMITGISGQDGSYLAEFLLSKGYAVHGVMRRASSFNTRRLDHIYRDPHNSDAEGLHLHYGDIGSSGNLSDISGKAGHSVLQHARGRYRLRRGGWNPADGGRGESARDCYRIPESNRIIEQ